MATSFGFLYMGTHWHLLKNTTEPSMCGGDVALCQITLTTCYCYRCRVWWQTNFRNQSALGTLHATLWDYDGIFSDSAWPNGTVFLRCPVQRRRRSQPQWQRATQDTASAMTARARFLVSASRSTDIFSRSLSLASTCSIHSHHNLASYCCLHWTSGTVNLSTETVQVTPLSRILASSP